VSGFVVLEGIDGAGTTTQTERLRAALAARGRRVHATREPSTGPVGRLLREILAGQHQPVDQPTLALLFAADRADHLQREIAPQLAADALVVSDRYYHSSLAYQAQGDDPADLADLEWVLALNARARPPDLTIFLDVPVEVAAARRAADRRPEELFDRLETQRRVAAAYARVNARLVARGERLATLDGTRSPDELAGAILALVLETCPA
jgi:dTMP kinase